MMCMTGGPVIDPGASPDAPGASPMPVKLRLHPKRPLTAPAFAVVAAMTLAPVTPGQSTPNAPNNGQVNARVNEWIDQLAAPNLADRDKATEQLESFEGPLETIVINRMTDPDLTPDLTPEQFARVETALKNRFFKAPRAALGVGFAPPGQANNQRQPVAVILERVLPEFPCSKTLKPGDIIRVIDGIELPPTDGANQVRSVILSHLPGEELELVIERDGIRHFFRVPLGDFARLNSPMPRDMGDRLKSAWEIRKARLGLGAADSLSPLKCVTDGTRSELPSLPRRKEPELRAGGSPDNGAAMLHLLRSRAASPSRPKIAATAARRIQVALPAQQRDAAPARQNPAREKKNQASAITQLNRMLQNARAERERYMRIVARNDIEREQQEKAIATLAEIEARIASLNAQLRELRIAERK